MTDRHTVDSINSDQLDQLYDDLAAARARIVTLEHVAAGNKRHVQLIVPDLQRAEATVTRVEEAVASFDGRGVLAISNVNFDIPTAWEVLDKVRAALDEPAEPQPARWLHIAFTSPDATTANTSALALADHVRAEFPGVGMRITTNAAEAEGAAERPTRTTPNNPAGA